MPLLTQGILQSLTNLTAYAVCMDFILALAPCFIVWELNMKKKDKLLTISALSLGVL